MKHKKSLLIICSIICLFSISSVCASDVNDTIVANSDGTVLEESSPGTFTDLANKLNCNESEIILETDYIYDSNIDSVYQNGIDISKTITLDGKGHTISGNGEAKLLRVTGSNVILKNLIFINSYSDSTNTASAVSLGGNGILDNCTFMNINVKYGSSALSASDSIIKNCYFSNNHARDGSTVELSSSVDVINCKFINNSGSRGGGIRTTGIQNNIINCEFINNSADNSGAISIFWSSQNNIINCSFIDNVGLGVSAIGVSGVANNIENCYFINNEGAGIVSFASSPSSDDSKLINCYFVNNTSIDDYIYNGIVNVGAYDCLVFNCSFINNTAKNSKTYSTSASAICVVGFDGIVTNCFFSDNYAERGSAIYWMGENGSISNCIFINNVASEYAGAIYWTGKDGYVNNCTFINNTPTNSYDASVNVIKKQLSMICSNYSFYYNYMGDVSINILSDIPVNSHIIFNVTNVKDSKSFTVNLKNNIAELSNELSDLYVGNWTVNAIFDGDDNYYPCNATFTVTINPMGSICTIENINATMHHKTNLMAHVVDSNNSSINEGKVIFFDGSNVIGESNVNNGVASLSYIPNIAGEHLISVAYSGDNYLSSSGSASLLVDSASVDVSAGNGIVGFNSTFVSNVKGLFSIINEGFVSFYVDGVFVGKASVVNGVASLTYTPLLAGNFMLKAVYGESDKFSTVESSTIYRVNQANSQIVFNDVLGTVFHEVTLSSSVVSSNNLVINEGIVTFMDNGNVIGLAKVVDGVASLSYTPNIAGEHLISAVYNGDNYLSSSGSASLLVDSASVDVSAGNGIVGFNSTFVSNVKGLFSIINEGFVSFYVDGVFVGKASVVNGVASLTYTPLLAGNFMLKAVYGESDKFSTVESSTIYRVNQANSQIVFNDVLGTVFHEVTLSSSVVSSNNLVINEGIVTFMDNGNVIGLAKVVDGVANLFYTPTTSGEHIISATYIGTNYLASNNNSLISIAKENTQIISSGVSTVYNGDKYLVATLKDAQGNPIHGVTISVNLNGVKKLTTDVNGQVKLTTNALAPKTYTTTIVFAGDDNYVGSSVTVKVTVTKATPKLTAVAKTFKVSVKTKQYTVTLKDNKNKAMNKAKVTIKVNGKTFSATTNSKGQATFKITNLNKKSTFKAVVTYAATSCYNKVTKNVKITVK